MTRDEAILAVRESNRKVNPFSREPLSPEELVGALNALGLLTFEENDEKDEPSA